MEHSSLKPASLSSDHEQVLDLSINSQEPSSKRTETHRTTNSEVSRLSSPVSSVPCSVIQPPTRGFQNSEVHQLLPRCSSPSIKFSPAFPSFPILFHPNSNNPLLSSNNSLLAAYFNGGDDNTDTTTASSTSEGINMSQQNGDFPPTTTLTQMLPSSQILSQLLVNGQQYLNLMQSSSNSSSKTPFPPLASSLNQDVSSGAATNLMFSGPPKAKTPPTPSQRPVTNSNQQKNSNRMSYPREFKLMVIEYFYANGSNKYRTCKEFQITKSMLNGWLAKLDKIRQSRPGSLKSGRSGRKPQFPNIEKQLFQLYQDQVTAGHKVGNRWMRDTARVLAETQCSADQLGGMCRFSERWLSNFKKRYGVNLHKDWNDGSDIPSPIIMENSNPVPPVQHQQPSPSSSAATTTTTDQDASTTTAATTKPTTTSLMTPAVVHSSLGGRVLEVDSSNMVEMMAAPITDEKHEESDDSDEIDVVSSTEPELHADKSQTLTSAIVSGISPQIPKVESLSASYLGVGSGEHSPYSPVNCLFNPTWLLHQVQSCDPAPTSSSDSSSPTAASSFPRNNSQQPQQPNYEPGRRGRKVQFPQVEKVLYQRLVHRYRIGKEKITNRWLQDEARSLAAKICPTVLAEATRSGRCLFSEHWLHNFKKRNGVTLKGPIQPIALGQDADDLFVNQVETNPPLHAAIKGNNSAQTLRENEVETQMSQNGCCSDDLSHENNNIDNNIGITLCGSGGSIDAQTTANPMQIIPNSFEDEQQQQSATTNPIALAALLQMQQLLMHQCNLNTVVPALGPNSHATTSSADAVTLMDKNSIGRNPYYQSTFSVIQPTNSIDVNAIPQRLPISTPVGNENLMAGIFGGVLPSNFNLADWYHNNNNGPFGHQ